MKKLLVTFIAITLISCASRTASLTYHDPNMDFAAVKTVAVMPLDNLSSEKTAADRVRDVFTNMLLATGEIYVIPAGEVSRAALRAGITNTTNPSTEEIIKLAAIAKVDAVITGVVREYGEVRTGTTSANVISLSVQITETNLGRVIWSASSTKGGISMKDRLLGGGGKPMNDVTEEAVNDIINKLFR